MFWMIYQSSWDDFLNIVQLPPNSLWLILIVSFSTAMLSTILNKLLTDTNQVNRQQDIIKEHSDRKKELSKMAEDNPKRYAKEYAKFQRRDKSIQKMQQNMSLKRLKPMCFTFLPFLLFFWLLRDFYSDEMLIEGVKTVIWYPVAKPPMNPWDIPLIGAQMHAQFFSSIRDIPISEGFINFSGYYILTSFALNIFIQKIFGVTQPGATPGSGGLGSLMNQQTELPKPKF